MSTYCFDQETFHQICFRAIKIFLVYVVSHCFSVLSFTSAIGNLTSWWRCLAAWQAFGRFTEDTALGLMIQTAATKIQCADVSTPQKVKSSLQTWVQSW